MWSIYFSMFFSGMMISAMTEDNKIWCLIFYICMMGCVIGKTIAHNKQEKRIEIIEKQLKELEVKNNERNIV